MKLKYKLEISLKETFVTKPFENEQNMTIISF